MTRLFRLSIFVALTVMVTVFASNQLSAAPGGGLISHQVAAGHGLTRAWFTQVRLDPGRGRVEHVTFCEKDELNHDTLFVQTDRAALHVIDAETGQTLWVKTIGRPNHPSLPLGVGKELVAVVNGTKIYILKRADGKLLWTGRMDDIPTAGVCISKRRVFVPTISGRVIGYKMTQIRDESILAAKIDDKAAAEEAEEAAKDAKPATAGDTEEQESESLRFKQGPAAEVACGSSGAVTTQPIIVRDDDLGVYIGWTTSKGMFVAHIGRQDENRFPLLYELAGGNQIVSRPSYLPPQSGNPDMEGVIFVASLNGSVYAHSERQGVELWKRATGQPIVEPVVPIGQHLYVTSELGGMYCLATSNGSKLWHAPQITKFIAASPTRLYVADKLGRLLVLDQKSGARIDTLPFAATDTMVCNMRTDRIYLVNKTGLVQCLHETELAQPARHSQTADEKDLEKPEGEKKAETNEEEAAPEAGDDSEDPFA